MEPLSEDDEGNGRKSQAEQANAEDDEGWRNGPRPIILRNVIRRFPRFCESEKVHGPSSRRYRTAVSPNHEANAIGSDQSAYGQHGSIGVLW